MKTRNVSLVWLAALAVAPAAAKTPPKDSDVMFQVNGVAIRRSAATDRAWKEYGLAATNEMVDELLVGQALAKFGIKADAKEVEARLKRVRDQFPDEKSFLEKLQANGSDVAALRGQIQTQVAREALVARAKGLSVSADEVTSFYDGNKEKLGTPGAVHLRHILLATQKQAEDFLMALRAGADFSKLAAQASLDSTSKDRGGDLGFVSQGTLQPEIEKEVFSLKPGEVGSVFRNADGYHLFKAEEFRASRPSAFNDIKDSLKQALLADKITKAWPGYLQELRSQAKFVGANSPAGGSAQTAPRK